MSTTVQRSTAEIVFQSLGLLVVCFGSAFVSGSVCVIIYKEQKLRTITNMFILNLAIANLLIAVFILPFIIATTISGDWLFGRGWCVISGYFLQLLSTASIFSICAISVQRFYMMARALSVKITASVARRILGFVWFESAVISTPPLFGWNSYRFSYRKSFCSVYWLGDGPEQGYLVFYLISCFIIPLVIIGYSSWRIHSATKRHKMRMTPMMSDLNSSCASLQSSATSPPLETLDFKSLHTPSLNTNADKVPHANGSAKHAQTRPTGSLRTFGAKSGFHVTSTPAQSTNSLTVPERDGRPRSWPNYLSPDTSMSAFDGSDFYLDVSKNRHSFNSYKKYLKPSDSPSTSLCRRIQNTVVRVHPKRERSSIFEIRATKSLVLGFSTFVLCFAPYFLSNIFSSFLHKALPPGFEWFLCWLYFSNMVISTVLYGFFNSRIRHALRKFPLFAYIFKDSRDKEKRRRKVRWQIDNP